MKEDISADDRKLLGAPMVLDGSPRSEGFEASGVLFLFPMMLLAILSLYHKIGALDQPGGCSEGVSITTSALLMDISVIVWLELDGH